MAQATRLRRQAIMAAKQGNWTQAVELNQQILSQDPKDVGALNRLGVSCIQLNQKTKAKEIFLKALAIDKTNPIAKRHLANLANHKQHNNPIFNQPHFIEEPGKTKTIDLHRLAGKKVLKTLSVGQACQLKPKSRYISVEVDGQYIGALPEDISFRLTKLINMGNKYTCSLHSCTHNTCRVYIREISKAQRNAHILSFPPSKSASLSLSEADEKFLLDAEEVPMEIVETDRDKSSSASLENIESVA